MVNTNSPDRISMEALLESGDLGIPVLHPGGMESTCQLATLCQVKAGKRLLDVASGTGETSCFLSEKFDCKVTGVDHSEYMVETANRKAVERGQTIEFKQGDAHNLPFESDSFDVVISECTTCALEKQRAIQEMVRVARPGGYVGIGDLYWKEDAPESIKTKLVELENERPETLVGWKLLFQDAGLQEIETTDLSDSLATMTAGMRKQLGLSGLLKIGIRVVKRWGFLSLRRILASERILRDKNLGYVIVTGRKVL